MRGVTGGKRRQVPEGGAIVCGFVDSDAADRSYN